MNDLVPLGIVIAIEPLPVIGFILVLSTDRGIRNGAAFIAAWLMSFLVVIGATLFFTGGKPVKTATAPATWSLIATVVVGLVLLGIALERRLHPRPEPPPAPGWTTRLDDLKPTGAAVIGFLLQPWALIAAGAADVMQADLSKAASVVQLVLFVLLGTSSLLAMQIYSMSSPEASREKLEALRSWLDRHRNRAITILAFLVGLWLVGKGVYGLINQS